MRELRKSGNGKCCQTCSIFSPHPQRAFQKKKQQTPQPERKWDCVDGHFGVKRAWLDFGFGWGFWVNLVG